MKKISFYSFALSILVLAFSACEQDKAFPEFKDLQYGAIPRLIEGINGTYGTAFNFNSIDDSFIEFTVEFYDENQGRNVASYAWSVSYNGGSAVQLASVDAGSFGTSPDGLPSTSFRFTFGEVLSKLGLTIEDVEGGKSFAFRATLTKTDGTVFTAQNTAANLQGQPAFKALFQINVPIICPSELEGTFEAETVGSGPWGCTNTWTGTVKWVQVEPGVYDIISVDDAGADQYDFSMGAYWVCYGTDATLPGGDLRIVDACSSLSYRGASRWGESYVFNSITVNGATATFDWVNSYGEGGVTTLTRTDGKDWPDLKF
ncbi:MAG: hypothetical protein RLY31_2236 [Bacteroidota bacterium]|jgi:hypothetical protein